MENKPPFETFEFFQFVKKAFGKTYLNKVFSISSTQIQRWCRNPKMNYEDKPARNPMDRYENLLTDLVEGGHVEIAHLAVSRQARIVGCTLSCDKWPVPDKKTVEQEILDDLPLIADFQQSCVNAKSVGELMKAFDDAADEMKQNIVKRCEKEGWKYRV